MKDRMPKVVGLFREAVVEAEELRMDRSKRRILSGKERLEQVLIRMEKKEAEDEKKRCVIAINLVTKEEMESSRKERTAENDHKLVECLMATGMSRATANRRVREWNARNGWYTK